MKNTLLFACLLSASYASVQCMDEKLKPLLLGDGQAESSSAAAMHNGSINADTPEEQLHKNVPAGTPSNSGNNVYTALLDDMEQGVDQEQSKSKFMRTIAAGLPQPNDFYTGKLYDQDSTTYLQFWLAYNIPESELYRNGAQLDEYVRDRHAAAQNRQGQENARECQQCWGSTCCGLCVAGCPVGFIIGMVYWSRWANSCGNNNNPDCVPDLPDNTTLAFNVTQLIKSKME